MAHPTHPVWGFANQLAVGPHFGSRQRNGGGRGNMGGAHLKRAQGMSLDGDSYGFVLNFPFQQEGNGPKDQRATRAMKYDQW